MHCAKYERGEGINLEPDQKPGSRLVIQTKDGQQIEGELIAVKENSLLLKEHESGVDVSLGISDISVIEIVRGSKSGRGALYGGLIGAGIAILILHSSDSEMANDPQSGIGAHIVSGLLGGLGGLLIGAIAGPAIIPDKKIHIKGQTERQIQWILDDLRKKARVPDFQ